MPPDDNPHDNLHEHVRQNLIAGTLDPQEFFEAVAEHSHNGLIGVHYVNHGDDWVELAIDYQDHLIGDRETGILASGPIVSLCDMGSGMAIMLTTKRFFQTVTIDLRVDYLRPAKVGASVTARMQCYRHTRNIAFVRGQAHDGDRASPIAQVSGTFMFLETMK